jgi:tRNA (mo5U34)-methyltransferase
MSVYELASLKQKFDIIFCFGVYYHLYDPYRAFAEIRHCCHRDSIVLFEGDMAWSGLREGDVHYRCSALSSDWPWTFLPSPSAFDGLLQAAYLRVQSKHCLSHAVRMALKSIKSRLRTRPIIDRTFTVCTPFEGANELHRYRPPFGLEVYDARFRQSAAQAQDAA